MLFIQIYDETTSLVAGDNSPYSRYPQDTPDSAHYSRYSQDHRQDDRYDPYNQDVLDAPYQVIEPKVSQFNSSSLFSFQFEVVEGSNPLQLVWPKPYISAGCEVLKQL